MDKLRKPKLLVIGGTGFIGYHLIKKAKVKSWDVTSISLKSKKNLIKGVKYYRVDLRNEKKLKKILNKKFDYVVNLGGYINHQSLNKGGNKEIEVHFHGVMNLIKYLSRHKLKRFVQIGSSDEYGDAASPQKETSKEKPISPYSLAKLLSTNFLIMLNITENFPSTILRLFLTYGPKQNSKRFLPQIIKGCLNNNVFKTTKGNQIRDFCYIDDVIDAIFIVLKSKRSNGEIFNVASGKPISIKKMINKVCKITQKGKPKFGSIPYRDGENMKLFANTSKIKKILGWKAKITLDEGLKKTIESYK